MIALVIAFVLGAVVGSPLLWFVIARTMVDGMPWNWTCWPWNRS